MSTTYGVVNIGSTLGVRGEVEKLWQKLMLICLGDEQQVNRLLEYERGRSPHDSEGELMRSAIYRWKRDNRISQMP